MRKSSSDFASSRVRASTLSNRRTFSIAITAWSAKVVTSSICLSVNGRVRSASMAITPIGSSLAHERDAEHGTISARFLALDEAVFRVVQNIGNMDGFALEHGAAGTVPRPGAMGLRCRYSS